MSPLTDPEFLPYKLDLIGRRVLWVRLTAAQRREAAFLDDRALPRGIEGGWLPMESLSAAMPPAGHGSGAHAADAIFHIGHCGSTLLSRLLETWNDLQALREPMPLRELAQAWPTLAQPTSRLSPDEAPHVLQALWARWSHPLPPAVRTVVKATSSCNGLVAPLLDAHPAARAVLLDMPLQPYLATLLKSPASVLDAASAAAERLQHLHARGWGEGLALHALSLPGQCAMGWLAERARFDALVRGAHGARVLRVDFEALLAQPEATLHAVATHLSLDASKVGAALASPAWQRYSKEQSHQYGRDDRAHDLALAEQRHRDEITAGVAWVRDFVRRDPALRAVAEG